MPSVSSICKWVLILLVTGIGTGCNDKTGPPVQHGPHKEIPEEGTNIQAFLSQAGMVTGQLESRVKGKLRAPFMLHYQRTDSPYFEFPQTLHVDFFKDSIYTNQKQ